MVATVLISAIWSDYVFMLFKYCPRLSGLDFQAFLCILEDAVSTLKDNFEQYKTVILTAWTSLWQDSKPFQITHCT
jgi:hypothetical protein